MPSENQCNFAREVTGSRASDIEINLQCAAISRLDRYLLSISIEKILRPYQGPVEEGWNFFKSEIEDIAMDYLVCPASAFYIFTEWKASQERRKRKA